MAVWVHERVVVVGGPTSDKATIEGLVKPPTTANHLLGARGLQVEAAYTT